MHELRTRLHRQLASRQPNRMHAPANPLRRLQQNNGKPRLSQPASRR